MPAGNDAAAAATELADRFAIGQARAEDLRDANRNRFSNDLRTAQKLDRDEEATAQLDWGKAASACDVDLEDVIDAAVRGGYVVVVYENERGDALKAVCEAHEAGVDAKGAPTKAQRRRREAAEATIAESQEQAEAKATPKKKSTRKRSRSRSKKKG